MGINFDQPRLYIDNQYTTKQIENRGNKSRSKHVEIAYHYTRHIFHRGFYDLVYIQTDQQPADTLSRALNGPKLKYLIINKKVLIDGLTKTKTMGTKRPMQPVMGMRLAMLALTISLLAVGVTSGPVKFDESSPIVWTPTENFVDVGMQNYDLTFNFTNPCGQFREVLND